MDYRVGLTPQDFHDLGFWVSRLGDDVDNLEQVFLRLGINDYAAQRVKRMLSAHVGQLKNVCAVIREFWPTEQELKEMI